jgi:uncharacterized membrane protein YozB (DUF420 family)
VLEADDLPALNAGLNALATVLLLAGFAAIRRRNVPLHRRCMLAAFATSTLFLAGYLVHKFAAGDARFGGAGLVRNAYYTILASHVVLAAAIVPLATTTLVLALRNRLDRHRKLARLTLPLWLYVSVTGVLIWWMLYSGAFGEPLPAR